MKPVRLRLSRRPGFRLQVDSMATNGLPAVKVDRRTRWGNPWRVGDSGVKTAADAVRHFRERLDGEKAHFYCEDTSHMGRIRANIADLRGKNLACWCKAGEPCHADVLLELANA